MFTLFFIPLGRSIFGVIADARKDSRFLASRYVVILREKDDVPASDSLPVGCCGFVRCDQQGLLSDFERNRIKGLLKELGVELYECAAIINGGTTVQQWALSQLAKSVEMTAFNVQPDRMVELQYLA